MPILKTYQPPDPAADEDPAFIVLDSPAGFVRELLGIGLTYANGDSATAMFRCYLHQDITDLTRFVAAWSVNVADSATVHVSSFPGAAPQPEPAAAFPSDSVVQVPIPRVEWEGPLLVRFESDGTAFQYQNLQVTVADRKVRSRK